MITIKTSQVFDAISAVIASGDSPCLIGPSGIGKTQIVSQYAQSIGAELIPVHLISFAPEDMKFPIVDPVNETVSFVPAKMFMEGKTPKLFFWDEITHASTMLQSLCYQVFEGNRLGDYPLPADAMHIAAHNRVTDRGVHNRVPMPLRRRWYELQVEPDLQGWSQWAVTNGVDPLVLGFIRWRPEFLYQDSVQDGLAPDPRAWAKISTLYQRNPSLHPDVLHALVCGKVGEGVAAEFTAFLRLYRDLPNLDALLLNPDKAEVPTNPASMYAIASGLSRKMTVANIGRAIKYLNRLPAEFGVLAMKDALLRDKALQATPELTKWAIANQDVVL